jgi:hypothetical protein
VLDGPRPVLTAADLVLDADADFARVALPEQR